MSDRVCVITPVAPGLHEELVAEAATSALEAGAAGVVIVGDGCRPAYAPPRAEWRRQVVTCRLPAPKRGRSAARNWGARIAVDRGGADWLFFLDADDVMMPWAMSDFGRLRYACPIADCFYADVPYSYHRVESHPDSLPTWELPAWTPKFRITPPFSRKRLRKGMILNIGMFVRADRFREIGGFNEYRDYGEDHDFALRYCLPDEVMTIKHSRPFIHVRRGTSVGITSDEAWEECQADLDALMASVQSGEYDAARR